MSYKDAAYPLAGIFGAKDRLRRDFAALHPGLGVFAVGFRVALRVRGLRPAGQRWLCVAWWREEVHSWSRIYRSPKMGQKIKAKQLILLRRPVSQFQSGLSWLVRDVEGSLFGFLVIDRLLCCCRPMTGELTDSPGAGFEEVSKTSRK